jgi:hypothetical protein
VPDSVLVYTVHAEFADEATRETYLDWLRDGHVLAVVREGGALSGEVTVLDSGSAEESEPRGTSGEGGSALGTAEESEPRGTSGEGGSAPGAVESRYLFESRAAFDAYEAGPGIALRADGTRLFPAGSGVKTTRMLGTRAVRVPD